MTVQNATNIKAAQVKNGLSSGILTGGILTVNGGDSSKFDLTSGTGYVVDNYTNPDNPTLTEVAFAGGTGLTVTNIGTTTQTFIAIDSSGSVVQKTDGFTLTENRDYIVIGLLLHPDLANIIVVGPDYNFGSDLGAQYVDLTDSIGVINRQGNIFSPNGSNLNIDKTAGETFRVGANYVTSDKLPNVVTDPLLIALTFIYVYRDGAGGTTSVLSQTDIDPDQYDDNSGTLAAVPNNKFTIQHITFFTNSNTVTIEYGQNIYSSLSEAEANIQTENFESLSDLFNRGSFRCWLITEKGAGDLSNTALAKFISAGKFGSVAGGGGTAAVTLQGAYDNSLTPEIVLDATRGAVTITDASTPLGANLFEVENFAQTTTYFSVDATGAQIDGALTLTTVLAVDQGGTGAATLTDGGILIGSGTGAVTVTAQPTNGKLLIGSTGSDPVLASLTQPVNGITIVGGAGSITFALANDLASLEALSGTGLVARTSSETYVERTITGTEHFIDVTNGGGVAGNPTLSIAPEFEETGMHGWNGALLESARVVVTSDGSIITASVEKSGGGGDLHAVFSDGFFDWDTTPADTVTLTAGSDTSPTSNYVYLLQSDKTLTSSTAGWPSEEHAPMATVICQSAASIQTDGVYKMHAWTDHLISTDNQGHNAHVNEWIRSQNATWKSGVAQTYTITTNGGAPDNVILTTSSGVCLQLHSHDFPAFTGTPDVYVVNDSVTPNNKVTDLNALLTDSTGASMSGRYFSLVIWGVVSEDAADCKLFCNLPSGSYSNSSSLNSDLQKYANYTFPQDYVGTAFLISEWKVRHSVAASGTWTSIDEIDLRGTFPSSAAGTGTGSTSSEFADNALRIFNDGDSTKELAFEVDGITTSTTRTLTVQDKDGTIALVNNWIEETTTSRALLVNQNVIGNNAGTITMTLPASSAVGDSIRVLGKGAGAWKIALNASQIIHLGTSTTTTGVTGYLESTEVNDAIELVCIVTDLEWAAVSSIGNITVV